MDITTFHASRRYAEVKSGRIAYLDKGRGPAALFVHGVPLNGFHWRNIIDRVHHRRRCIAVDLMALGYSEIAPTQDVSFTAQARTLAAELDRAVPTPSAAERNLREVLLLQQVVQQ